MYRLEELAHMLDGTIEGPASLEIRGVAPIVEAGPTDISMAADPVYLSMIPESRAGAFLVGNDVTGLTRPHIQVANPRRAFATLLAAFAPNEQLAPGIHETAILGSGVSLGAGVSVQPYVTVGDRTRIGNNVTLHAGVRIGNDVQIGDNSVVYANAVIRSRTTIGNNVIIHANAVLGSDGYGFVSDATGHHKVPHIGSVIVGDDVELGACVTVDRGTCGSTRIGRGTKIGNLTQVAHNVHIGEHCLIVGMAGLAGSSVIADRVTLAGQVGVIGHLTIGAGATVAARGLVTKDVPAGAFISGTPARAHSEELRIQAGVARVPQLLREMKALRVRLAELEAAILTQANAQTAALEAEDIP